MAGENRMKKRKSQIRHDVTEQEDETLRKMFRKQRECVLVYTSEKKVL